MGPYLFVWLITYCFAILDIYLINGKLFRIAYAILFLVLIVFIGTRFQTGPDLGNYNFYYILTPSFEKLYTNYDVYKYIPVEPAYMFLSALLKTLGFNFEYFLLLFSSLFVFLVFKATPKHSSFAFFSIMLYLYYGYFTGFSAIRQVLAAAIFYYGIQYIISKNIIKYLICIAFASLFHVSAIVLFPLYYLARIELSSKSYLIVLTSFVVFRLLGLFALVGNYLFSAIGLIGNSYLSDKTQLYSEGKGAYLGLIVFEWIILILFFLYHRSFFKKTEANFVIYFNLFFLGFISYTFFSAFGDFGRIIVHFKLLYLILIPLILKLYRGRVIGFFIITLFSVLVLFRLIISIQSDTENSGVLINRYIPYKSWLIK